MLGQRPKEITSENEFWMELRISRTGMIEITGELCWTENFQIAVQGLLDNGVIMDLLGVIDYCVKEKNTDGGHEENIFIVG